jgi:hypothetical protein
MLILFWTEFVGGLPTLQNVCVCVCVAPTFQGLGTVHLQHPYSPNTVFPLKK